VAQRFDTVDFVQTLAEVTTELAIETRPTASRPTLSGARNGRAGCFTGSATAPAGEMLAQATDRLAAISAIERRQLTEASRTTDHRVRDTQQMAMRMGW